MEYPDKQSDRILALIARLQDAEEALRTYYDYFNARVPEHREYGLIDIAGNYFKKYEEKK